MIKIFLGFSIGFVGGVSIIWPGILTAQGWECANDLVLTSDDNRSSSKSLISDFNRKIKVSSSLSVKTLLNSNRLSLFDKFRVVGDSCFR